MYKLTLAVIIASISIIIIISIFGVSPISVGMKLGSNRLCAVYIPFLMISHAKNNCLQIVFLGCFKRAIHHPNNISGHPDY